MHQYKSNALSAADVPYILEDYWILTRALEKFREKLIADGVLVAAKTPPSPTAAAGLGAS